MIIDRRIINGLTWAGALLVVGVPTADLLSAQLMGPAATPAPAQVAVVQRVAPVPAPMDKRPAAPVIKPAVTATTTPVAEPEKAAVAAASAAPASAPLKQAAKPAAQTANAVEAFLQTGRELPSYISDGETAPAAPTQVAVASPSRPVIGAPPVTDAPEVDPVEVAAIKPQKVAPVPMPLSMRPEPVTVALVRDTGIVIPPGLTPAVPASTIPPSGNVTQADLEDWETGPLSDFLAAHQAGNAYVDPRYDADGFFLDQGPNRPRRDRVIARENDPFIFFAD